MKNQVKYFFLANSQKTKINPVTNLKKDLKNIL